MAAEKLEGKNEGPLQQVRPVLRIHFYTSTLLNNAILIERVTSQCKSIRRKQVSLSVGFRVCIKIFKMARDESHVLVLLNLFFILSTINGLDNNPELLDLRNNKHLKELKKLKKLVRVCHVFS